MSELTQQRMQVSPDSLKQLLAVVTTLPRSWVLLMCVIAVASALDLTTNQDGVASWHVAVGPLSLIALALIWLPTALRYLVLAGGSLKAAGVEAATSGLLSSPENLIGDLADIRSRTERIGQDVPNTISTVQQISTAIDDIASKYLPAEDVLSDEVLNRYARDYETIRRTMPPGNERTQAMSKLVNEVRIRAAAAPESARRFASAMLRSPRDGDRLVGLALVEGAPSADAFNDVLRIFTSSVSAFEQYHSLQVLSDIAPALTPDQQRKAIAALETEMTDPRGVGLMDDAGIRFSIDRALETLQHAR